MVLHLGFSCGETLMECSSFRTLAEREGLILAFPDGWGHSRPGPYFTDRLGEGDPLAGFDAVPILGDFFERQPPLSAQR